MTLVQEIPLPLSSDRLRKWNQIFTDLLLSYLDRAKKEAEEKKKLGITEEEEEDEDVIMGDPFKKLDNKYFEDKVSLKSLLPKESLKTSSKISLMLNKILMRIVKPLWKWWKVQLVSSLKEEKNMI